MSARKMSSLSLHGTCGSPIGWKGFKELPRPQPVLLLRSIDNKSAEILLYLSHEDSKCEVGPLPSGNYIVSLVANGFAPDPVGMPITIGDGIIPGVKFQMKPRGSFVGHIVSPSKQNYQAGVYREPDEKGNTY